MAKRMDRWELGMRDAFSTALYDIARQDSRVILVTSDTGAICHDEFKKYLKCQYLNVGIAEQNLVGVGAGLAMSGKIVYIYAIVPFATMRCYEQIRIDLCCMNLPVTVVGIGAGYDYNTLGPTHHGTEDISLMRGLPAMTVFSPSDSLMVGALAKVTYELPGPKYLRLDRTGLPLIYQNEQEDFSKGLSMLRPGRDLCIIATGRMVYHALQIADSLKRLSIDAGVVDLYRIKPLNEELLLEAVSQTRRLVTLEEHFLAGGIGSIISEFLIDREKALPLKRLGIPDRFCRVYGSRADLYNYNKLDIDSVVEALSKWAP